MRKQFTPREYQNLIIGHQLDLARCGTWAGMGMGKTVSTLTALETLYLSGETKPTLVLAPLRVCNSTWPEEAQKWEHLRNIDVIPVTGAEKERLAALNRDASVYACNYQNVPWLVEHYGAHWPFGTVIADESTRLKSFRLRQGGVRAQALAKVAHTKIKRFINLTGTPAPNGMQDLWGQTWFLDKGERLGKTYTAFTDRWFCRTADGFGRELRSESAADEIYGKLRDICLTIEAKDWFDLQEPIVKEIEVDMPRSARKLYDQLKRDLILQIEQHTITAANAAVKTQKLLQMANGAAYVDPEVIDDYDPRSREYRIIHDAKLEALDSIIEECNGAPILLAYNFRSDLERILKAFKFAEVLDDNPETLRRWNSGKIRLLCAHPQCLHPSTEVLTEFRGWVRIIDVKTHERVFDGIEFVAHSGCQYSGYREVIECFGITLTPGHKLLVNGVWRKAEDVRNNRNLKAEACYTYTGNDPRISQVFQLRGNIRVTETARHTPQREGVKTLYKMLDETVLSHDRYTILEQLAGFALSGGGYVRQGLRRARDHCLRRMARLQKFLQRYVSVLYRGNDDRAHKRERRVFERKLQMGTDVRPTGEQTNYAALNVPGAGFAFSGAMPINRTEPLCAYAETQSRHDSRRSSEFRQGFDVPKKSKKAHVYDLVDCGPRNRFLIRNAAGEMFISHNSAGHGLNLQDGGNILVFFGHNWNLEDRLQIIERIGPVRQLQAGYDRPVWIYNIVCRNTVDKLVMDRVESKKTVQELLMANMKRL